MTAAVQYTVDRVMHGIEVLTEHVAVANDTVIVKASLEFATQLSLRCTPSSVQPHL